MCKALDYVGKMTKIINETEQEFNRLNDEQRKIESAINDVIHFIENEQFNGYQGYMYAKKLQDLRKRRRQIKEQKEKFQSLITKVGSNQLKKRLEEAEDRLTKLNKRPSHYNPRVYSGPEAVIK